MRRLNLQHDDKVYATPRETGNPNSHYFTYEIAEKGGREERPGRIQLNYCPVLKEAGRFAVERSAETGEFIRFNEGLYPIVLDENDVFDHKLSEGHLIDIAYPEGKPNMAKVLWKHNIETIKKSESNTLPNKKPKKETKAEGIIKEQTLEGKTVLVIGNEPKRNLYKFSIEQRGGEFLWADAKFNLERLEPLVRKADVVCFLLSVSGHVGMEHIKRICKGYDTPFETTWSNGQTSIVRIAEEAEVTV